MKAWLAYADPKTKLLPDRLPGLIRGRMNTELLYTPHNSGADNYPFLILTAYFTDRALFEGRMVRHVTQRNPIYGCCRRQDSRQLRSEDLHARPSQFLRRRRVLQGRHGARHRIPRPHALVLPHGGYDRGLQEARARENALGESAVRWRGVEWRRAADAGAPDSHDRRSALAPLGGANRRRLHRRDSAAQQLSSHHAIRLREESSFRSRPVG